MGRLLLALALVLTACSRDDSPTASAVISGSYELSTVNDRPLPFSFSNGDRTLSAERITIVSNNSLDISSTISFESGTPSTTVTRFGYVRTSSGLVVASFGIYSLTITGDSRAIQFIFPSSSGDLRFRYVK